MLSEGDYELQKQLAIKDALLADWELKNRALRESVNESSKKQGDLEEQLAIKKFGYDAHIKRLTEEIERVKHFNSVLSNQKTLLQEQAKTQRETYDVYIEDIQGKLDTQKDVFEGVVAENQLLIDQVKRLEEESKDLKTQIRELRYRASVTAKLEKVLTSFE